ncbi:response regulator [Pseudofrankia inefficax]|uniref:Two component transcriptional regulator, winged helix family n=1 Tax=Pseudofrankia inefficax (strain DSM 45817 / CECT 9037 / DDB 130130 / EuI1c) TaxID=298654 RepID=E3JB51_PSEI1|nr:response regulator [Pseudofrankia inefficax]ADP84672.1 two component transcriptional regulator, winged helix family [Pseudofrankia inefficax]
MTRVLIVDDEPQILRAMRINLRARGYEVVVADTGATALTAAAETRPDIVILDLGLPDLDGVEVIHGLRGWTRVPIVVLSGRADSRDKVGALDAGADDYITKPFGIDELLARLRAVARRTGEQSASPIVRFGRVTVDLAAHRVTRSATPAAGALGEATPSERSRLEPAAEAATGAGAAGHPDNGVPAESAAEPVEEIHLTKTEWGLLKVLLSHPGKLVTQRQLLTEVWGANYGSETHYLRTYLNRLRQKLEEDPARPRHLLTDPGMGYRFQP